MSCLSNGRMFWSLVSQEFNGIRSIERRAQARAKGLTPEHFDTFLKHFGEALSEVGVKPDKAEKVMKLLEAKHDAVPNP